MSSSSPTPCCCPSFADSCCSCFFLSVTLALNLHTSVNNPRLSVRVESSWLVTSLYFSSGAASLICWLRMKICPKFIWGGFGPGCWNNKMVTYSSNLLHNISLWNLWQLSAYAVAINHLTTVILHFRKSHHCMANLVKQIKGCVILKIMELPALLQCFCMVSCLKMYSGTSCLSLHFQCLLVLFDLFLSMSSKYHISFLFS